METPTSVRWLRAKELFQALLERPLPDRAAYLADRVAGDRELLAAVEALLSAFGETAGAAVSPARHFFKEGDRIGGYAILRHVGTGGMGSVYAAARVDRAYQRLVAIKVVNPGMDSQAILGRFLRERQMLAGLDHPNIARLLDGGTTDHGLPYLVMEYVEGTPIDEYCDRHRLSVSERLKLFVILCHAVQYAHQNLIVHRDVKAANVLVTAQGVPKLLDFGIAKLLRPDLWEQDTALTGTQLTPMTPEYASPEQLRGEPITTASDIYSLGVLLYGMLTGRLPYQLRSIHRPSFCWRFARSRPSGRATPRCWATGPRPASGAPRARALRNACAGGCAAISMSSCSRRCARSRSAAMPPPSASPTTSKDTWRGGPSAPGRTRCSTAPGS